MWRTTLRFPRGKHIANSSNEIQPLPQTQTCTMINKKTVMLHVVLHVSMTMEYKS